MNRVPPLIQFKDVVVFELYGDESRADALRGLGSQVMERLKAKNANNLAQLSEHLSLHDGSLIRCIKNNNFYTISIMCPVKEEVRQEVEASVPKFDDIKVSDKKPIVMVFMVEKIWSEMNEYITTGGGSSTNTNGSWSYWNDDDSFFSSEASSAYDLYGKSSPLPEAEISTFVKRFARVYAKIWPNGKYKIISDEEALKEYCSPDPWNIVLWRRFLSFFAPLENETPWCMHTSEFVNFAVGHHALEPRHQVIFSFGRDLLLSLIKSNVAFSWSNNKEPQSTGYSMYGVTRVDPSSTWHPPVVVENPDSFQFYYQYNEYSPHVDDYVVSDNSYEFDWRDTARDVGYAGILFKKVGDDISGEYGVDFTVSSSLGIVWYSDEYSLTEAEMLSEQRVLLAVPPAWDTVKMEFSHFLSAYNYSDDLDIPDITYDPNYSDWLNDSSVLWVFYFMRDGFCKKDILIGGSTTSPTLTISGDKTSVLIPSSTLTADCGVDGLVYGTVVSSYYNGTNTVAGLSVPGSPITSNLVEITIGEKVPSIKTADIHREEGSTETTPGYWTCGVTETPSASPVNVPDDVTLNVPDAVWLRPKGLHPGRCSVSVKDSKLVMEGGRPSLYPLSSDNFHLWEGDSLIENGINPKFTATAKNGEIFSPEINESSVLSDESTADIVDDSVITRRSYYEFDFNEIIDAPDSIIFEYKFDDSDYGVSPSWISKFEIKSGGKTHDIVDTLIVDIMKKYDGRIYAPAVILPRQATLIAMVGGDA